MEITESSYIELLKKKLGILNDVLILTENVDFSDKDISMNVHAENYCALYDKRASLLEQAVAFDKQLNLPEYKLLAQSKNERFITDYESLVLKIKEVVHKLLELDEKNKIAAEGFMTFVKNNIRDIKIGRNVNTLYQTEVVAHGGIYFDKKN